MEKTTFFLGALSLIQITFLPGYLLLHYFSVRGLLKKLVFSFGLSLLINYQLVFLFTVCKINLPTTFYIVFLLELILLIKLKWFSLSRPLHLFVKTNDLYDFKKFGNEYFGPSKDLPADSWMNHLLFAIKLGAIFFALSTFYEYLILAKNSVGLIFHHWDAAVSWNRWAVDWGLNRLPIHTWNYPQLLTANWSISYIFMQTIELQMFPRAITPLFTLYMLLILFDLAFEKRSLFYFVAIYGVGFLLPKTYEMGLLTIGYADIPVTFMGFLGIVCFVVAYETDKKREVWQYTFLAILFIAGSALTKQSGLFIFAMIPIFLGVLWFKNRLKSYRLNAKKSFVFLFLVTLVLVGPWYIYKRIQIYLGHATSEVSYVTKEIYKGATPAQRQKSSLVNLKNKIGSNHYQILIILLFFSLLRLSTAMIAVLITVPFTILWSLYFCYDFRNLSMAVPLAGLGAASGFDMLITLISRYAIYMQKLTTFFILFLKRVFSIVTRPISPVILMGILLCIVIAVSIKYPGIYWHKRQIKDINALNNGFLRINTSLNQALIYNKRKGNIIGKVISDYALMDLLPGFKNQRVKVSFDDLGRLQPLFVNGIGRFILIPNKFVDQLKQQFPHKLQKSKVVFAKFGYTLIKFKKL